MSWSFDPRLADCRRIFLEELSIEASIGFHDFELAARQRIFVCIEVFVGRADSTSGRDDVADVLDYDEIRTGIQSIAQSRHFNLQETLLDEIIAFCLGLPGVRAVMARTQKPDVYPDCKTVGIECMAWSPTVSTRSTHV